jgi:nucleotide-binding universal stress UspA family protein
MNVLVGVDESPFSAAAVEFVKGMPWATGTRVRVVSAAPPLFAMSGVEAAMPDVIAQLIAQQERHHAGLAAAAAKRLADVGVACEDAMVPGDPRSALVEEARRWKADLVVVGSHGRSGIKRMVLGSVAAHVASQAPCSVLIVKEPQAAAKD